MGEMSKVDEVAMAMFKELSRQNPELASSGEGFGYAEAGYQSASEGLTILDGAYDLKAVAKAAIEAMYRPTEKMLEAGIECGRYDDGYCSAEDHWQVMIDAALKE